jgi:hypothetical protein
MDSSRPPVFLLALGLRFLWYGVFFRILLIGAFHTITHYFPGLIEKIGNLEFVRYYDYGLQGTSWLIAIGALFSVAVPWATKASGAIYVGCLLVGSEIALETIDRFAPAILPDWLGPHLQIVEVGLMVVGSYCYLRACAKLNFWMRDTSLEQRSRRASHLSLLASLVWVGRFGVERIQPELFAEIPPVERFDGPMVAFYGAGLFVGLAMLLWTNVLAFTSLGLREVRYEE